MSKIILYIAISQDGFIADKNGGVDWLPQPDPTDKMDEYGYEELMNRISHIIMGSRSYEQILEFGDWAWGDKITYVFTSKNFTTSREDIFFINESPKTFMKSLEINSSTKNLKDTWLLGGAELVKSFAKEGLIDECVITIIPQLLGEGIKLEIPYADFNLIATKTLSHAIVQQFYEKRNDI